jgi:hypothetical protein
MFFRAHYTLRNFDLGDLPVVNLYVPVKDGAPIKIGLTFSLKTEAYFNRSWVLPDFEKVQ